MSINTKALFITSGLPRSGKTTTAKAIQKYLLDHGQTVAMIDTPKKTRRTVAIDLVLGNVHKTVVNNKVDYIIVDGPFSNAVERSSFFDTVFEALNVIQANVPEEERVCFPIIGVQLNRSNKFMFQHNEENGKEVYSNTGLIQAMNNYQQEVKAEGFDLVYNLNGTVEIDMEHFATTLVHYVDGFPVDAKEEEDAAEEASQEETEPTSPVAE